MIDAARQSGFLQGSAAATATAKDCGGEDEKYTDYDLFALLIRGAFGGFNSFTWDDYCHTPDEVIRHSYCAEFDEGYNLVTLMERRRRWKEDDGVSGNPSRAGRELPSREELNIPAEAWAVNPRLALDPFGQAYTLMTWSVWRKRQRDGVLTETGQPIDDAYIMRRWAECAAGR